MIPKYIFHNLNEKSLINFPRERNGERQNKQKTLHKTTWSWKQSYPVAHKDILITFKKPRKNRHIPSNVFSHNSFSHRNKTLRRKIKLFKDSRIKRRSFAQTDIKGEKCLRENSGLQTDCKHMRKKVKIVGQAISTPSYGKRIGQLTFIETLRLDPELPLRRKAVGIFLFSNNSLRWPWIK
ncbi:hypothetical protein CEXT_578101 [Caerostris extrusa]|uniref:Uncharacterized protein n=1 Tax=Caerostris extrusa TaxID=172846 RepID=A0AAV4Y929_CAEEX|nr:hypothetical protein CEXT_578101 [Caerostris extrusa]